MRKIQKLTDDDFVAYQGWESKTGGSRSAKSVAELSAMGDDELISFLNDWEDVHRDPEQWWIDVDFDGVGYRVAAANSCELQNGIWIGESGGMN